MHLLEESQVGPTRPCGQPGSSPQISYRVCSSLLFIAEGWGSPILPGVACGIQMLRLIELEAINLRYCPSDPSPLLGCHFKALVGEAAPQPRPHALGFVPSPGRKWPRL